MIEDTYCGVLTNQKVECIYFGKTWMIKHLDVAPACPGLNYETDHVLV
jgi:hypothetical protein